MCLICIEVNNGRMKSYEASLVYTETRGGLDPQHQFEVFQLIFRLKKAELEKEIQKNIEAHGDVNIILPKDGE